MQIFIIDDDAEDRAFFIKAVKEVNNRIICSEAENGEIGLNLLKKKNAVLPDCIFLDLRMPLLNGIKVLEEIKKDEKLNHIPVYIYTTSRDVKESIETKEKGAVHFISKPQSAEEIYYLVACALEGQV